MFAATAFEHVLDSPVWHFFESLHWEIHLPWPLTKYSVLMILAGALILWIYLPLAKKIQTGEPPRGPVWNLFEFLLTFVRDNIAKPYIPGNYDRYVPYLWTVFLFVLFCNLLGMIPFLGSPTASFAVTSVLALGTFLFIHINTILEVGVVAHLKSFAPDLDMPAAMKFIIIPMIWVIEFLGLIIKCFVLAVRLFANMFAGHMVLATILLFIPAVRNSGAALFSTVTVSSVLGVTALSLLELFVAFLQAFIFTFLTALFFGGVLEHAQHAAHAGHEDEHGAGHPHAQAEAIVHPHAHAGTPGHHA
jgi:F-type H+-transporting ATPase subunit a